MLRLSVAVACLMTATAYALPVRYDLSVQVDVEARTARGHARITVENTSAGPLHSLWLWRYPERFATRSPALNDYNFYWVYPARFNSGQMRTGAVLVDGRAAMVTVRDHPRAGPGTLLEVTLDPPLAPDARATLDLDFSVRVPKRYGPFGCVSGSCTLSGFYPMVAPIGWGLDALPGRGQYRLRVTTTDVADVVVNGRLRALERGGQLQFEVGDAAGLTLQVGRPKLFRFERIVRGVRIVLVTPQTRGLPSPKEFVLPYQPANRVDRVLDAAADAVELLDELGVPLPAGEEIHLLQGGLRIELAQALPGVIFLSDQLFDIFPLQRFLKFHQFELARAIYEDWIRRHTLVRERPDDLGWAPGVGASYLVDLYTLRSYRKTEFARQILAWASFIPAIDRVMYAPQVPFASSYFYTLEDPDPLRDTLQQFNNDRPTGKTPYTKLRDLLGTPALESLTRAQLGGAPIRAAAQKVARRSLDWFWKQWLGPYPYVDYRFAEVRTERLGPHAYRHRARVVKLGPEPPVEPVEVRVTDKKGQVVDQTWDGTGREHTYVFETAAPLRTIEIDPRGRLVENLPGANDDLKFNDRLPPRWKFIYNNFGGLLRLFPTLGFDLSLDFSLSRILDLKNALRFIAYRSESTQVGLTGAYTRAFGRKVNEARLSSAFTFTLGAARIDPSFGKAVGAGGNPGTQLTASAGFAYDDRLFVWEPMRALSLGLAAGIDETVLDNGTVLSQGTVSAGWESIVPLADGHGLAMSLDGAVTFGDLRIARQMLSAGGGNGLRGYDVESLLGRWRANSRFEYRHVFTHALDFNIMHSLYVRGIAGAVFAEAGLVSPCDSYRPDAKSLAADVGYSLRFFADWFGVSQTTIILDFAVPLVQHDRACFGQLVSAKDRVPFGFFFTFAPPW